jgi:hypothetical protein
VRKLSASLVFIFLAALNLRAAWIEKESRSETSSAQGLIHRYLVSEDSETGERASIELALFAAKSFTLRVIDQPAEPRVDLAVAMQRAKCLAGVNGGYFAPDYAPIGLLIVDLGRRVAGLEATRAARRTFAAVGSGDRAALGFCSEVTLADLSKILTAQFASDFKIQRALNLDGGSSSGFWFKRQNGSTFSVPEQKTVRDFVAVVPR